MKLNIFVWVLATCAMVIRALDDTTVVSVPPKELVGVQNQEQVREKRYLFHGAKVLGAAATGFAVGAGLGALAGGWNYGGYHRGGYYDDGPYYGRSYGYGYPSYYSVYYPRRSYVFQDNWY